MAEGDEDDDGGGGDGGGGSDSGDVGGSVKISATKISSLLWGFVCREKERDGALKSIACETIPSPRSCRQSCWQGSFNKQTDRRNKAGVVNNSEGKGTTEPRM
uniref:Uncharacterized protein n=1 Tax=Vespula pensylvanica TaxID=30213 RepID=A0A834P0A7_VESPE|nr:hypothetical protein H0235_008666 [Vespula pensylvanica]